MKVSVLTLGCKTNQAESSQIERLIKTSGHNIVGLSESPELCIVNTCTVTSKSDYQSRQLIRRACTAGAKVIVTGCYSEINRDSVEKMGGVVKVFNNRDKLNIINGLAGNTSYTASDYRQGNKSRFFIKVQDGCNYSCSYCIIPRARGNSRSIEIDEIIMQINDAAEFYNEVVLTGIHLGTYGYDLFPKVSLYNLLKSILDKTLIRRIRLSSLEVKEIDERLLSLIKEERVCKHLHIPLQSGDDKILRLMNRNYTVDEYLSGFTRVCDEIPDISIGTDVIVGFPAEGEGEFESTRTLLDSLSFSYIHVFQYSDRPGTKASEMTHSIDPLIKKERSSIIRELDRAKKTEHMSRQVGRILDLLIEERLDDSHYRGITGNYLKLMVSLSEERLRDILHVRVSGLSNDILIGHPIET